MTHGCIFSENSTHHKYLCGSLTECPFTDLRNGAMLNSSVSMCHKLEPCWLPKMQIGLPKTSIKILSSKPVSNTSECTKYNYLLQQLPSIAHNVAVIIFIKNSLLA